MKNSKTKGNVIFLRPNYNVAARHHIEEYLNADSPDFGKVVNDLRKLYAYSDRIVMQEYSEQCQISAFFTDEETGKQYCVSGLGTTFDLAVLSCFAKCEFVYDWQFVDISENGEVSDKPHFS